MKKSIHSIGITFLVLTLGMTAAFSTSAAVTQVSAAPNPARQGYTLQLSARADRAGIVYFFFRGRPFGSAYAPSAGWVSVKGLIPANTVPLQKASIVADYSAQQYGHYAYGQVIVGR